MTETLPGRTSTLVGAVLGNYRITGALSSGGMGTVFRAQHELLGRNVAMKLLRPELTANVELVQRFFHEAKAATAIHHPGIIDVYDFGYTDEGRAYIVMELLEGEVLSARLARRGRLTEIETAQIGRGIASALTAAHGKNIVHRDLKPANVFLVPDPDLPSGERPKVLDFGIAKLADLSPSNAAVTQTGALMGTPLYMAPEQARAAGTIDHRADLYSLGCMMYEMVVGEPPFVAPGAGEIIAMQLFTPVVAPGDRVALSAPMNQLILRLLEKDPHTRCQTAAEVVEILGALTGGPSGMFAAASASGSLPRTAPMIASFGEPPVTAHRSAMPVIAAVVTGLIAIGAGTGFYLATRNDAAQPALLPPTPVQPDPVARPVAKPDPVVKPDPVAKPDVVKADPVVKVAPVVKLDPVKPVKPAVTRPQPATKPPEHTAPITSPAQIDHPGAVPTNAVTHPGGHVDNLPVEDRLDPPKQPKDAP